MAADNQQKQNKNRTMNPNSLANLRPNANPGGRPKKNKDLVTRCQDLTEKVLDNLEEIVEQGKPLERIKAGEIILAYGHGKPTQRTELTGQNGDELRIVVREINANDLP
jgi:hypothetical protein